MVECFIWVSVFEWGYDLQLSGSCILSEHGHQARGLGEYVHVDWDVGDMAGVLVDITTGLVYST